MAASVRASNWRWMREVNFFNLDLALLVSSGVESDSGESGIGLLFRTRVYVFVVSDCLGLELDFVRLGLGQLTFP